MRIVVSYPLRNDTPLYPGTPPSEMVPYSSMDSGDSSNTTIIRFHNHSGTHIDLPLHFCSGGKSLEDYSDHYPMNFRPVYCIRIDKNGDEPILPEDFSGYEEEYSDAEAILVNTGTWRFRDGFGDAYVRDHPWVHPLVPGYLRKKFPQIRLFGIDTISIATPNHREEGRDCHRNFLCGEHPVLLLEDMDLSSPELLLSQLYLELYPIIISDKIDGVPVLAIILISDL